MDVFDLVAKIRLDTSEYESGLGKAKGGMSSLASGVGEGLVTVAKVGAAAVSAGVAGVAALTKMGVAGYSTYQQLEGGMKKIFDGMDVSVIANDAANAYKDLGMSANEYLAVINDAGATFAATMGNEAGYAAAKKGLTAISDYASGTGKNFNYLQEKLSMITRSTTSYQSIADQFSGILPATSDGFLKQAQAAGILEGKYKKLTDVPINEYQKAVTDMLALGVDALNLTGNTADEAASTLSGSMSMMKAAWENLVVGMADENANLGMLIDNFVESAAAAAQNLLPRIEQTLAGIGELIIALSPVIAEALPQLVETVLPVLVAAGISLITALVSGLITAAPAIYEAFKDAIFIALTDVFGMSEDAANNFVTTTDGIIQDLVAFFQAGFEAVANLFAWLVEQANTEGTFFNMVWENIQLVVTTVIGVIQGIIKAFTAVLQGDWSQAWSIVQNIAQMAWDAIVNIISSLIGWISGFLGTMVEKGFELIASLAEGIQNKFAELFTLVGGWVQDNIVAPIEDMGQTLYDAGVNLLGRFWDGLKSAWDSVSSWWDSLTLSDKSANVNVNRNGGGYATGLNYVPYDEFPAILHRGEAVLTAAEARVWRNGGYSATPAMAGGVVINQYIQSVPQTPVELASATEAYFEQARWAL